MSRIISMDISGNWKEGKGTTGLCYMEDGEPLKLDELKASDFDSAEAYWLEHTELLLNLRPDHVVIEGYKLYNHKGQAASKQANSELETPQLKGAIRLVCFQEQIPLTIQFASEVKTRWSDTVLQKLGYLNGNNKFKGQRTSNHKRDALRHALHFWRYKLNESK